MERIKTQADKFWSLVTDPQTFAAYQTALTVTWNLLREAALLAWLTLCLVLVVFEWFWNNSIAVGRNVRNWFDNLEGSSDQIASQTGKALLSASKNSLSFTVSTAKNQLGISSETGKNSF